MTISMFIFAAIAGFILGFSILLVLGKYLDGKFGLPRIK